MNAIRSGPAENAASSSATSMPPASSASSLQDSALERLKRNVEDKLETRRHLPLAVEQTGMSPATCSSWSIVLILILELALFFTGAMT